MYNRLAVSSLLIVTLCTIFLFFNKTAIQASETSNLLVQALPHSPALNSIIEQVSEKINFIVREELGLDQHHAADFFSPKPILRLTFYYANDIQLDGINAFLDSLDKIRVSDFAINNAFIEPSVEFFGGPFSYNDELVIMIADSNHELSQHNAMIKKTAHEANEQYKQIHNHNLYNIEKSERYPYHPHIGLGRLRSDSIKTQLKDPKQFPVIFERIQSRVKKITMECINTVLTQDNKKLMIDRIGILDLNKRTYIKEYVLKK